MLQLGDIATIITRLIANEAVEVIIHFDCLPFFVGDAPNHEFRVRLNHAGLVGDFYLAGSRQELTHLRVHERAVAERHGTAEPLRSGGDTLRIELQGVLKQGLQLALREETRLVQTAETNIGCGRVVDIDELNSVDLLWADCLVAVRRHLKLLFSGQEFLHDLIVMDVLRAELELLKSAL